MPAWFLNSVFPTGRHEIFDYHRQPVFCNPAWHTFGPIVLLLYTGIFIFDLTITAESMKKRLSRQILCLLGVSGRI